MPCRADHMEPNDREIELSKILAFLEELKTGKLDEHHLKGYHPSVYCEKPTQEQLNDATSQLCKNLRFATLTHYSLELQIWWRKHQKSEERREREDREELEAKEVADRKELARLKRKYETTVR